MTESCILFFYNKQFLSEYETFLDGLCIVFVLFHMCSDEYPKILSLTLEFLQRFCIGIHNNDMRGAKRTRNSWSRVLNLISNKWIQQICIKIMWIKNMWINKEQIFLIETYDLFTNFFFYTKIFRAISVVWLFSLQPV